MVAACGRVRRPCHNAAPASPARGQYTTVDNPNVAPGTYGSLVEGINNAGQIVGVYTDSNNFFHGYAANPVNHGASAVFGNVVVSPPFLNGEAAVSTPLRAPAAPSMLVGPGLVGSAMPQGQTASAVHVVGKADPAGNAVDQVFANFHDSPALA